MSMFQDSVAVVTGAGSGIGQQLALQLAKRGARVAISDIDSGALSETETQLKAIGEPLLASELDVADQDAMFGYAKTVTEELGGANLVVNNAGVALATGTLDATKIDDFEWLMRINFFGVLYGTKAFLPLLKDEDWGHIVNISSLFGLIGVPEQSAYNASKFAVRGLTEALRQELELEGSHISCTSVHPGGVKTNIARNARQGNEPDSKESMLFGKDPEKFDQLARTTAESAAQQILRAVEKDKRRLLIGADAKLLDWVQRVAPNHYQHLLKVFAKLLDS